ncbi:MAG TPA: CAP domain-containing protein [Bradyrhizobium sp.]|uniref:CAP domain-containing protein n=1 Tax=Bradyrhizobium sp. TaxID=376 RepID=UPI002C7257FF|nr:CAP domain-containing protein [Bradyrhizobium sp.]HLZ01577.1 CAP domain-containing protein [Bradyrhizobium sp.]
MTGRAIQALIAAFVLIGFVRAAAAGSPADMISSFRIKHGEVKVVRDPTLDRIALAQARAMAAKDDLSHEVLGSFSSRIVVSRAGRAAENIAYGYDTFDKTLLQWIDSSEHRKNLLLHNASRIGIASAKDASGKRTYWAMEIAGDYEKPGKGKGKGGRDLGPLVAVRRVTTTTTTMTTASRPNASKCHIKLLSLCL